MTIIDTIQTQTTDTAEAVAEVRRISPHDLIVEDNIRSHIDLDRAFVNSIKLHGVIVPILAHPDTDGNIIVRDGQRRTFAAREADLTDMPVYVVDAADEKRIRIIQQYITNEHRTSLTDADRAEAWRQLALDGMSVTAIAKQTGTKRNIVKTGLTVAGSDIARKAVTEHAITLDQALILTQFEDDPDTLTELTMVAAREPESFDHVAQRMLDDKAIKEEIAQLREKYEAEGFTVVDYPAWDDTDTTFFHDLLTADGERLTEDNYVGKDGHAVAIGERWGRVEVANVVVGWRELGLTSIRHSQPSRGGSMSEEEKAERRRVIANNKSWVSAEKVRRAWVAKLLGRKRLPSQALAFAATVIADDRNIVARAANDGHDMASTLLNLDTGRHYGMPHPVAAMTKTTPAKAGHALLALALGALEASTDKNSWRNPNESTRRYLTQLAAWGYTLSDVETLITDPDSANRTENEDTTDEHLSDEGNHDEDTPEADPSEDTTDTDDTEEAEETGDTEGDTAATDTDAEDEVDTPAEDSNEEDTPADEAPEVETVTDTDAGAEAEAEDAGEAYAEAA